MALDRRFVLPVLVLVPDRRFVGACWCGCWLVQVPVWVLELDRRFLATCWCGCCGRAGAGCWRGLVVGAGSAFAWGVLVQVLVLVRLLLLLLL